MTITCFSAKLEFPRPSERVKYIILEKSESAFESSCHDSEKKRSRQRFVRFRRREREMSFLIDDRRLTSWHVTKGAGGRPKTYHSIE